MSGVTGGRWVQRTMARNEAPTESRKRSVTATPRAYGTAPALDPSYKVPSRLRSGTESCCTSLKVTGGTSRP